MDEVGDMPGLHMKNLFLKDKKKNLYLLCARHDSKINLNDVAKKIGAKELRFADENTLKNVLGVTQGCVTLYALVNDPENRVHVLLDSEATKNDVYEFVNFHPLVNSATLGISPKDIGKFLELVGHKTTVLDI
ncbi:Prolyl-tRNA synthetase associated domain-containing protein 1 [Armadillidium vulgare]|nr:Prolyl-tRNA synthetase associated domain-containing protein 1 [Armadillidium vulgare]